jgi:hypothetical protein
VLIGLVVMQRHASGDGGGLCVVFHRDSVDCAARRVVVCLLRARTRPGQVGRRRLRVSVMVRCLKGLHQRCLPEVGPVRVVGSAGDVKDRADLPWVEARDQSAGLFGRDSDKVNVLARSLLHHLMHDRQ